MIHVKLSRRVLAIALAAAALPAWAGDAPFARVGDAVITQQEFDAAFAQAARSKFYHGKPPEAEVAALQREVGRNLADEILLVKEAKRRNLRPDDAAVKRTIDGYEEKYKASAQWQANRARMLPGLKAKLEHDSVIDQLAKQVKRIDEPTAAEVQKYWETHKDKFTSPEQVHLSMILLKVDPSSPPAKWEGARGEGAAIVKRLKGGADFAQLAQLHSGDASAERGGDLGYVHQGMLPDGAQQAVDKMKPGEVSDPVVLLEGVAVFKLHARQPPQLNAFEAVKQRARDLLVRDRENAAWEQLLARLRRETPAKFDETRFLPLASAARPASP